MASSLVDIPSPDGSGKMIPLQIITKTHSMQTELVGNVVENLKRPIPRFLDEAWLFFAQNEPLAIVGGGPSLDDHIDTIKTFKHVLVCGSAHDYLISKGVVPTFAATVDAKEDTKDYFTNPHPETIYLVASQSHPSMFDRLAGYKVLMWHFRGQLEDEEQYFRNEPKDHNGNGPTIAWGCMIGVMSVFLAFYLGYQHLHFFGMDGNHLPDKLKAYGVGDYEAAEIERQQEFKVNGKTFLSTVALVSQMEHFFDLFASSDGQFLKGYVYGDGLWANVLKASPPEMADWLRAMP